MNIKRLLKFYIALLPAVPIPFSQTENTLVIGSYDSIIDSKQVKKYGINASSNSKKNDKLKLKLQVLSRTLTKLHLKIKELHLPSREQNLMLKNVKMKWKKLRIYH